MPRSAPDRLAAIGLAFLVGSIAAAGGLWFAGENSRVEASPPIPVVRETSNLSVDLCTYLTGPDACAAGRETESTGVVYVPAGGRLVVAVAGVSFSVVLELTAVGLNLISVVPLAPCGGAAAYPYYPGVGPDVFLSCDTAGNALIVVLGWNSSSIVGVVHAGTYGGLATFPRFAYDQSLNSLYVTLGTELPQVFLLTLNLANFSVANNVSLPTGYIPYLWASGSGSGVITAVPQATSFSLIDPHSGVVERFVSVPSPIVDAGADPQGGLLALLLEPPSTGAPVQILAFNSSTLNEVASTVVPMDPVIVSSGSPVYLADPWHGDLYVYSEFTGQILAYPLGSDAPTGSLALGDVVPAATYGTTFGVEYAAPIDSLIVAGFTLRGPSPGIQQDAAISRLALSHGWVLSPSYSALPWVGTSLPLWVAGVGAFVAAAVSVHALRVRQNERAEREFADRMQLPTGPDYPRR